MSRSTLLWIICLSLAATAWAGDAALNAPFSKAETVLLPSGEIREHATLDTAQHDTLFYDDGNPQYYYPTITNYWAYVRFTPPANFSLRSIYIAVSSDANATCSLYVHLAGIGTNPGTVLSSAAVNLVPGFFWYDVDLATPIDITSRQDFLILAGRAPGGAGWDILFDAATTTNRSKTTLTNGSRTTGPYYSIQGDYPIRAGGLLAPFSDLTVEQCFNSVLPSGDASFNVLPGAQVSFKGQVHNVSNTAVNLYTVQWSVRGPGGTVVYSNETAGGPIAPTARAILQTADAFSPLVNGEYNVTCVSHADSDTYAENDTSRLRFFVGDQPRWFRYDDNAAPESHVNSSAGGGWGVTFKPVSYAAAIESIRVELSVTGVVSGNFRIYLNDAQGTPGGSPLWETSSVVTTGWNRIAVEPPVLIYNAGQKFTLAYIWAAGCALGMDGTPPNCASIDSMGAVSWSVGNSGSQWSHDNSGNWAMQVYMDTSSALPPIIETNPSDSMLFGQVDTTGSTSSVINFVIHNHGTYDPIEVSQIQILPGTISGVFAIVPNHVTVGPLDSEIVVITFNPTSVRTYIGTLTVTNNSTNMPTIILPLRAEGVRPNAADDPAGVLPGAFALEQNFPNPFNPATDIRFALPVASDVRLTVFNVLGQETAVLAEGLHTAGIHTVTFDASLLPAGVYFYRLEAGSFSDIRKMLLLK